MYMSVDVYTLNYAERMGPRMQDANTRMGTFIKRVVMIGHAGFIKSVKFSL